MSASVFDRIERWLVERGVPFQVMRHEPVFTSADAARARGVTLASGAKALVCKADGAFVMLVLRANRGWKSLRFADREEVTQLTGLEPGSIPPFGSLFGLTTLCDPTMAEHASINFNAGDHAISIRMSWDVYLRIEQPELVELSEPATGE